MPSESAGVTGAVSQPPGPAPSRHVERRRLDGFVCHLAFQLTDAELASLVGSITSHAGSPTAAAGVLGGRAATWLHHIPSVGRVVIKEYRRGGALRHLRRRHYLRLGATRPEREFRILGLARAAGVCVPEPVASVSRGLLLYKGWLATREIPGTRLALLARTTDGGVAPVMERIARQVGLLIEHRIAHADLHPGNVLIDEGGMPYLLDFDKAVVFDGPLDELSEHYRVRWTRAVGKYGLPPEFAVRFCDGLRDVMS